MLSEVRLVSIRARYTIASILEKFVTTSFQTDIVRSKNEVW
jgi:hypothetical protein